jgi:hypothetical protein
MEGLVLSTILILTMVFVVGIVLLFEIWNLKKHVNHITLENISNFIAKENVLVRKRNGEILPFYTHVVHNFSDNKKYVVIDIDE